MDLKRTSYSLLGDDLRKLVRDYHPTCKNWILRKKGKRRLIILDLVSVEMCVTFT